MREIQIERNKTATLEAKLDKIADLLEVLVQMQEEEAYYPPENKMRRSFLNRAERLLGQLREGKLRMHTYRSFADFDRATG